MSEPIFVAFARAGAALQGITLDETRVRAVAGYLELAAGMAAQLDAAGLEHADEFPQAYSPAPFLHSLSRKGAS